MLQKKHNIRNLLKLIFISLVILFLIYSGVLSSYIHEKSYPFDLRSAVLISICFGTSISLLHNKRN